MGVDPARRHPAVGHALLAVHLPVLNSSSRQATTAKANSPAVEVPYGSGRQGLVCAFLFEPGQPGRPLDLEGALGWLKAPVADGGFVWLHFNLAAASAEAWIRGQLDVAAEFFEALREGSRSTRIEDAGDTLIAVVNDVAYQFALDASEIETLWVAVTPRLALSARLHALSSIDRLRQSVKDGRGFDSSVAFLNHLMRTQGDSLVRIARDATVRIDAVEDQLLLGRLLRKREDLGKLRRVLVRLRRLLAPEPGALFRLLRAPPTWIAEADLDELRQTTEEFNLVIHDVFELQERIKLLQEEIAAQVGEQTNRSLFTLTMVTVLALPINIVAGLLGMNVGGIPLAQNAHGFFIVAASVAGFTALAAWFVLRRRRD